MTRSAETKTSNLEQNIHAQPHTHTLCKWSPANGKENRKRGTPFALSPSGKEMAPGEGPGFGRMQRKREREREREGGVVFIKFFYWGSVEHRNCFKTKNRYLR